MNLDLIQRRKIFKNVFQTMFEVHNYRTSLIIHVLSLSEENGVTYSLKKV